MGESAGSRDPQLVSYTIGHLVTVPSLPAVHGSLSNKLKKSGETFRRGSGFGFMGQELHFVFIFTEMGAGWQEASNHTGGAFRGEGRLVVCHVELVRLRVPERRNRDALA